ncbi:MAG: hypothetical protein ACRDPY_25740 [Streptosporangiaceae bacterium]
MAKPDRRSHAVKAGNGKKAEDRAALDFARFAALLGDYERDAQWDAYFPLARAPKFQAALAAEAVRIGETDALGPLRILDEALGHAVNLGRVTEAADLTLAIARWTRRLELRTALGALRPGGLAAARTQTGGPGQPLVNDPVGVLRALLYAWELADDGNPGDARQVLGDLVRGQQPVLDVLNGDYWMVPLLRRAFTIDAVRAAELLRLVDDNTLADLASSLTEADELDHARTAALAIRLFTGSKVKKLAEIAIRQAEAGDSADSARTSELALAASEETGSDGVRDADKSRPDWLAALAAAQALRGDPEGAEAVFAEAVTAALRQASPAGALRAIAEAQVRAGLLAAADRTISDLTGQDFLSADHAWEAAATLVTALAARGDLAAASVLGRIPDFALCYPRAVSALAQAVARTDPVGAERLVAGLPEQSRSRALDAVVTAALAAGYRQDAERIANAIEAPSWRAQALIGLVDMLPPADAHPPGFVEDALAAVTDPVTYARLLAAYAVTRDGKDRTRLLDQAKRRVRKADREDRWSTLAEIAVTEAEAGLPGAAGTFAAARDLLLSDVGESDRDLRELCRVQLLAGDSAGARQTIAAALPPLARSPVAGRAAPALASRITAALGRLSRARNLDADPAGEDPADTAPEGDRLLAPVTLAGIATCLAESGATGQAKETVAAAARLAAGLRREYYAIAVGALADVYVVVGDLDAAESLALSILSDEDWDDEEDGEDLSVLLMTAVNVGGMVADALKATGHHDRADPLIRQITSRMRALQPGHEMEFQSMKHAFEIDQARARAAAEPAAHTTAWAPVETLLTNALSAAGHDGEEHPLDLSAVRRFIDEVPEGDPRARARMVVIDRLVAANRYATAAGLAEEVSAGAGVQLARLAAALGTASQHADAAAAGAGATLLSLLPRCARYPEAAHAACAALARAFPAHAAAIARAVARNAVWAASSRPDA